MYSFLSVLLYSSASLTKLYRPMMACGVYIKWDLKKDVGYVSLGA